MGVGTRSPCTTGGSYDDWRSVISKDLWLLRCSRLHLAQIAMIDMMITGGEGSADGSEAGGGVCAWIEASTRAALSIDQRDIFLVSRPQTPARVGC